MHCSTFVFPLILQELLASISALEFSGGRAEISEVSKCVGDVSPYKYSHG